MMNLMNQGESSRLSENCGKPRENQVKPRLCGRCKVDIRSRHGNARYCFNCTGLREKPYTVSCRVSEGIYLQIPRPHQKYLHNLIIKDLNQKKRVKSDQVLS